MATKYYLNKNLEWVEIPELKEDKSIAQTFPQNYTFGIDEALDVAEFSFFAPEKYHIPVDSIIKINNDGIIKYWVVKDSKSSKMQYPNIWTQQMQRLNTLTLVEPIDILRGFKLEPCTFTENSYTLEQIIKRLFYIANCDAEVEIPNVDYSNPKLTYVSTNLYLVFFELASTIDMIPYLDFNETTKKWILKFQRRDGLNGNEYNISIFSNPKDFVTEIGEGLAKNVYCEISNLTMDSFKQPSLGGSNAESMDGSGNIDRTNIGLELKHNVKKINQLTIFGFYSLENNIITTDYEYPLILKDNERTYFYDSSGQKVSILTHFIKDLDYQNLTKEAQEKEDEYYVTFDNNKIYLNHLTKKTGILYKSSIIYVEPKENFEIVSMLDVRGFINSTMLSGQESNYTLVQALYQIDYAPIFANQIPMIYSNDSKYDDIAYFNQTSTQISPDRSARVLQSYIDNMSHGSMIKSGVFYSWSEIPMPGSIIKDGNKRYLIDSITIEQKNKFANVDAQLCLERARRRLNMEADTKVQINTIPNDELVNRLTYRLRKIIFSIKNELLDLNKNAKFKYYITLNNDMDKYQFFNYIFSDTDNYSLIGETNAIKLGNNIIYTEKARDNFIWDVGIYNNKDMIVYNYTNSKGRFGSNTIVLKKAGLEDIKSYPYISTAIGENQVEYFEMLNKDPYEIFNFTFQINYRGINNTIVREEYVEYLLNGVENPTYSIRLFNINIGKYDNLPSEYVAEIGSVSVSEFDEENNYISVDFTSVENSYKSIVLLLNNKPIMIKNYFEEQTGLSSFKIYLATEDGTPVRTGVMGIDPYEEESN